MHLTDEQLIHVTNEEMEHNWKKYHFGRCICCGNGYDKDDWRWERTMFEEEHGYDAWEGMYCKAVNEQEHEVNGVCFECADEIMKRPEECDRCGYEDVAWCMSNGCEKGQRRLEHYADCYVEEKPSMFLQTLKSKAKPKPKRKIKLVVVDSFD